MSLSGITHKTQGIWAKTLADGRAKSLLAHSLDVAAVASAYQALFSDRVAREATALGMEGRDLARLRVWLASLHDLGKCSVAFQAKSPDHWAVELLGDFRHARDPGHWRLGAALFSERAFKECLKATLPKTRPGVLLSLLASAVGHHGRPPVEEDWQRGTRELVGAEALMLAQEVYWELTKILSPPDSLSLKKSQAEQMSWQASGLIILADWVGSDTAFFEATEVGNVADYYAEAMRTAQKALHAKGLAPVKPTRTPGVTAVLPSNMRPRPAQLWADQVPLPDGPCLVVIEDGTGAGKTEAALILASRMLAAGKGEGLYLALPTEATADAMFVRLAQTYRRLYRQGTEPSLVLAHSRASVNEPFSHARIAPPGSTEAYCNDWVADHRRKAFFAQVGAGTIDQALLAVLKKRYLTLRQFGLAGRILIIDEAHAYDAYMAAELERLLQLHAFSGGSAIVLSATLPQKKRRDLVQVFAKDGKVGSSAFPLATLAAADGVRETPVMATSLSVRDVKVERTGSVEEMHSLAVAAAQKGGAVLVLRNAVDEAIRSAEALRATDLPVQLFHARFAQCDRKTVENDVVKRFGKHAGQEDRQGRILVATQVVEQSLDIDFDVILSDLAPIDLLIQRAGRLWRHTREDRPLAAPVLHVLSPEPSRMVEEDWLVGCLGGGAYVYRNPAVLWRSARAIFEAGRISTPDGLRDLIEAVYGPNCQDIPVNLEAETLRAEGDHQGAKTLGALNTIDFQQGGYALLGALSADQEIGTRLGEAVSILRLARLKAGRLEPWSQGPQAWARSELRVRETWVRPLAPPESVQPLIEQTREAWPDWDRALIGVVDPEGEVLLEHAGERPLRYDVRLGLTKEDARPWASIY